MDTIPKLVLEPRNPWIADANLKGKSDAVCVTVANSTSTTGHSNNSRTGPA